jgi:predicted dehydrogenase
MKKVKWGIISTADIGLKKVIPALQASAHCEVIAIASRSLEKAENAAKLLDIPRAYDSYEALLEDADIDAVYISLPNHLHVPLTLKALQANKHVLCEKPVGLSVNEALQLAEACKQKPHLKVMEAFMYRFHPQWLLVKKLIEDGTIGTLKSIHSTFSFYNDDANNIRNKKEMGGGSLMDIGCYCISLSRWFFGEEPKAVMAQVDIDHRFNIDQQATGVLSFSSGTASFTCSTQMAPNQRAHIMGSEGHIDIEMPFSPNPAQPANIWLLNANGRQLLQSDVADQYIMQADAFANAILTKSDVPTSITDAVNNMKVIQAIFKSGSLKQWVDIV